MKRWKLQPQYTALQADFGSLDQVFALEGEHLTSDPLSEVLRVQRDGVDYYVKRYWGAGKGVRRWGIGRSRVQAEWENLLNFAQWGIPTASIVAYGLEQRFGQFQRGALITEGLKNTVDLAERVRLEDPSFRDFRWVRHVSQQLADATRIMHAHRFAHNDLKWRNLLVDDQARLFFIDCPSGEFSFGPLQRRREIKDLACLDKVAKYVLSRTQRLRFYLQYTQRDRLTAQDRKVIARILKFFEGRE